MTAVSITGQGQPDAIALRGPFGLFPPGLAVTGILSSYFARTLRRKQAALIAGQNISRSR